MSTGPAATSFPFCRAASRPLGDGRLAIGLHDAGLVGVVAADEDLDFGVAHPHPAGEIRADPHDPVDLRANISCWACVIDGVNFTRKYGDSRKPAARSIAVGELSSSTMAIGTSFTSSDRP